MRLSIPSATPGLSRRTASGSSSASGHVVRSGDNDTKIAKRYGITSSQLRAANPSVNWRRLKLGATLNVPGKSVVASKATSAKTRTASASARTSTGTYAVRSGDNDWIIARRVGTTPKIIRQLNPSVKWSRLQIGTAIRVPGSGGAMVASAPTKAIRSRYGVIVGDSVAVRRTPTKNGKMIVRVDRGTRVTILDSESGWYKLQFPRGSKGWVRADFLKSVAAPKTSLYARGSNSKFVKGSTRMAKLPSTGSDLLDKANSFRGVRYRYGSASRSGTDCSGFTTQVFRSKGIKLPRTSAEQSRVGAAVGRGSLKEGDLVFFRTGRSRRVNHVGIYMGAGKFIHASSGGGRVQVNHLSDGYYAKRFTGARRVAKVVVAKKKPATPAPKTVAKPKVEAAPTVDTAPTAAPLTSAPTTGDSGN